MKYVTGAHVATTFLGVVLAIVSHQSSAQDLIVNGNFASTTASSDGNGFINSALSPNPLLNVAGWTNTYIYTFDLDGNLQGSPGYNWLFAPGTADGADHGGYIRLWGSNNGGLNTIKAPPGGGNFIASDGAYFYGVSRIEQTVTGLTPGLDYTLSFYWAAAQQKGYNGNTTEKWTVSLGGESFTTDPINLPSHGFSDWIEQSFTYTATAGSEVLSFIAAGTPNGEPPFSLLADVSMPTPAPTPEPTMLQYGALLLLIPFLRPAMRRFRKKTLA